MSHYEYTHPQPSYTPHSPKPKSKSKYSPAKIEADLRKTLSFLGRTLQNEFLNPQPGQSHRSPSYHGSSTSTSRSAGAPGEKRKWDMSFDEILIKGRQKLEKLVKKYRELNPNASDRDGPPEYESYGSAYNETREASGHGRWRQADEIEEVESIRSSRHRNSRSTPRAPSPPIGGRSGYGHSSRNAHEWDSSNPDYYSTSEGFHPHSSSSSTSVKRKGTGLSLDRINLPALIAHAGVILGIIEKVLAARSGGHGQRGSSGGGSLHTVIKVVRTVVALSEGLGLAGNGSKPGGSTRPTY